MGNFNSYHKSILDDMLLGHPHVRPGKMFGYPTYYVGKEVCTCLYEQGVGVKLMEQSAVKLLESDPNVIPFQPLGKPRMREWIQINLIRSEDYKQCKVLFNESLQYLIDTLLPQSFGILNP